MRVIRRMVLVCVSVATTFIWTGVASAQTEGVVRGRVETADHAGVPRLPVTLTAASPEQRVQTVTDDQGGFVFTGVRAGTYVLAARAERFRPRELRVTIEPREVLMVTLKLEIAPLDETVTVSADARSLPGTHSPSSTVLTEARLGMAPAFQRLTLPDAIVTAAPGMIRGHDDFVHVRGHEIALNPLIDGVAFWENPHALFSAGLSPEIIQTANVMTGGFAAEYGNRFGGVVDIVTKSGLRMESQRAFGMSVGDAGRRRGWAELGGRRQLQGYYAFGSLFETDRFVNPPDRTAIHDSARGAHGAFTFDHGTQTAGTLHAVLIGSGTNGQLPKTSLDVELRPQANAEQRTRQQTALVNWQRAWPNLVVSASAYQRWSRLQLDPAIGPLTAQAALRRDLVTLGGKVEATRVAGRHVLKFGLDAVRLRPEETLAYNYAGYRDLTHLLELPHIHIVDQQISFAGEERGGQISAFVQDRIALAEPVTLDVGVRVDRYGLVVTETHASPRLNLAVRTGTDVILHASYNHFFVPPAIEGVLSSSAGLTRLIREIDEALPALEPTVEDQFETGATVHLGLVQVGATGYYRRTDNPVHTTVWPDARIYSYASFERARAYGLEVKAELHGLAPRGVTGYVNYAIGRVYFYNPVTGGFITDAAHLTDTSRFLAPMDQTHTFSGGGAYRHARTGATFGVGLEYGSGTPIGHGGSHEHADGEADHEHAGPGDTAARIPSHLTGSVWVGIDVLRDRNGRPRLTLRADVENVTNRVYEIARESSLTPAQYSIPRLMSFTAQVKF